MRYRFSILVAAAAFCVSALLPSPSYPLDRGALSPATSSSAIKERHAPGTTYAPEPVMPPAMQKASPEKAPGAISPEPFNPPYANIEPPVEEPPSAFEIFVKERVKYGLKQFGYEIFMAPAGAFAPSDLLPVGPDYLLGPGDELKVSIWGKVNAEYSITIDRDGKAGFPEVGVVHLAGTTFSEAKNLLNAELARYFKPSEVKLNLSMGALRSMRVLIVGKALRPGSYTVSSLSTVINALVASGGPSKAGTMRDIQVKRNGAIISRLDLYDLLLRGDKAGDIRLQPEDVIFIPPAGPLVAASGYVKVPAIYELKDESTVKDLIDMAGGLSEIAFTGRIQIDRIVENSRQIALEASLAEVKAEEIKALPGDIISFYPIVSDRRLARLSGAVQVEGEYGVGDGLTVSGLIRMAGGLKPYAYKKEAELTRVTPTPQGPETVKLKVDLEKALARDPFHDIALKEDDYLFVRTVPEWELYRTVKIEGEVRFPGTYTIEKGETVHSLIERAGGFTGKAYLKGAEFTRVSVKDAQQRQLDESIERLEKEVLSESAGTVEAAVTPEAAQQQLAAAAQRRALIAKLKSARAKGRVSISLEPYERFKGSPSDLVLEDGDVLNIPEIPAQVQVIGSVYNQTAFVYSPGATVGDYIGKAGGMTRNADGDELYILKINGTAVSKREYSGWWPRWDPDSRRWTSGDFMSARLDPGDTVVVPEKIEKIAWLREVKDITQILYQIAVTAGVLIVAF